MCWDVVSTCTGGTGVESERRARLRACCGELPRAAATIGAPQGKEATSNRTLHKVCYQVR